MHAPAKNHITIDDAGVARVEGTPFKVLLLIESWLAYGRTVETLQQGFPSLSLAQIYAVLAYYYDHQQQIDEELRTRLREFEAARAAAPDTPGRKKLRDLGLRP